MDGAEELGFRSRVDLNSNTTIGYTIAQANNRDGARLSLNKAYIRPFLERNNLFINMYSQVTRILIDKDTKKVTGVEYIQDGKNKTVNVRKEVIVSAGAIQSPQLLLLSGIGPEEDLKEFDIETVVDSPRVGKNLMNHVSYSVPFIVRNTSHTKQLSIGTVKEYLITRDGPLSSTGLSQVTGLVRTKYADPNEDNLQDLQMFFEGYLANCSETGYFREQVTTGELRYVTFTPTLLVPESRGTITLKSKDPLSYPLINLNYLSYPHEVDTLVEGIRMAINLSRTDALKPYQLELDTTPVKGCEDLEFGSDDYWRCAIRYNTNGENHQAGTCVMGPDPQTSVVDPTLKVHGVEGLRVIDASIMPNVTRGNLNAPIIMVAEKGSDMIKISWGKHNQTLI
ncbi:hypothetical protein L9F63_006915 [Diploptera punctata]|uniref:Glucose-methanol-choline oxidoreductase N-terminal domain-containing protein n=1 Tax=Diploptera punctata TaxID=6984 RepID=A0AAD7Z9Q3_DIPPU|nr:hypothetical protein L9F63_006915 [Diploptera punctata]